MIKNKLIIITILFFSCINRKKIIYKLEVKSDIIISKYYKSLYNDTVIYVKKSQFFYKDSQLYLYSNKYIGKRYYLFYDSINLCKISLKKTDSTAYPIIFYNTNW